MQKIYDWKEITFQKHQLETNINDKHIFSTITFSKTKFLRVKKLLIPFVSELEGNTSFTYIISNMIKINYFVCYTF